MQINLHDMDQSCIFFNDYASRGILKTSTFLILAVICLICNYCKRLLSNPVFFVNIVSCLITRLYIYRKELKRIESIINRFESRMYGAKFGIKN